MPSNLNALIRYKTINSCLYGGRRKWTIRELIAASSEALAENRGRYVSVSERTTRDDIRIMRSDILGFNAPIKQEKGLYFYSDPEFSILTVRITDAGLADKIFLFLVSLRTKTKHPELETILEQLCRLTKRDYEGPVITKEMETEMDSGPIMLKKMRKDDTFYKAEPSTSEPINREIAELSSWVSEINANFNLNKNLSWGIILEKINMDLSF